MPNRRLLERLLHTPDLATIVPHLQPEILHRVIETCGLEDCGEVVALATPAQLTQVLDVDLWRGRVPGGDEAFDADRFGVWIAVLVDAGVSTAAEKLMGLDLDLVVAGMSRHAAVFDRAAVSPYTTLDGDVVRGREINSGETAGIGGYVIQSRQTSAWEPMVELLRCLEAEQREYFDRLMRRCRALSNSAPEKDGFSALLAEDDQRMFDLACKREARRDRQGFLTPAQARAFLHEGRNLRVDLDRPRQSAIARAYFRAMDALPADGAEPVGVAGVVEMLADAGVVVPHSRALPGSSDRPPDALAWIAAHVASHPASAEELGYLANVIVAGSSVFGRPFTPREASDAAVATCNLGLENWPASWRDQDLVTAFQIGWTIIHRDVGIYAAVHLAGVLGDIRCRDRDVQRRLDGLRRVLRRHAADREPWHARSALDVLIVLDPPAWAALLAMIDEYPVMHAALDPRRDRRRAINPTAFSFISQNSEIAVVREFLGSLRSVLIDA